MDGNQMPFQSAAHSKPQETCDHDVTQLSSQRAFHPKDNDVNKQCSLSAVMENISLIKEKETPVFATPDITMAGTHFKDLSPPQIMVSEHSIYSPLQKTLIAPCLSLALPVV